MYTLEQRERAVELYVRYGRKATATMRELGYPKSRQQLRAWHREWEERGGALEGRSMQRYTDAQKRAAVDHYLEHRRCGAYARRELGYPKSWKKLKVARVAQPLDPGVRDPDLGELAGQPRPGEPGGVRPVGLPRPGLGARGHGAGGYRRHARVAAGERARRREAGAARLAPAHARPGEGRHPRGGLGVWRDPREGPGGGLAGLHDYRADGGGPGVAVDAENGRILVFGKKPARLTPPQDRRRSPDL